MAARMSIIKRVSWFTVLVLIVAGGYCAYRYHGARTWRGERERAVLLQEEGRFLEAADAYLAARRHAPSEEQGLEVLSLACTCLDAGGRSDRAATWWKSILSDPSARRYYPRALLALARLALAENRAAEARAHLDRLFAENPDSSLLGDAYCARAELLRTVGDSRAAWEAARKVVEEYPRCPSAGRARQIAGEMYMKLLFSEHLIPGTEEYVVRPGDSLESIAKKYGTTVDLIREMNRQRLRGDAIQSGRRLKVCTETFSLLVDKSDNTLSLKAGERVLKVYPVGTGKGGSTPVGEFKIINKMEKPEWFKPGGGVIPYREPEGPGDVPENLLGTRWMGIDSPGYGIHGTWEPETVGKQASAGCIRLLNEDVEELYTLIPVGTRLSIVE